MMADENNLEWLETAKSIAVTINFEDPTPTPQLTITPGDPDALANAGKQQAQYIATKEDLIDMRAAFAQSLLALFYMMQNTVDSLRKYDDSNTHFTTDLTGRTTAVEKRMTVQEATYTDLITKLTDEAGGDGAAEVIAARTNAIYGEQASLKALLDLIAQKLADIDPNGWTFNITHGLGRNPTNVAVASYSWAIGTEPNGLGTGPDDTFGGTAITSVTPQLSYPDANTIMIGIPISYKLDGDWEQHSDGAWYLIQDEKTLKVTIS